MLHADRRRIAQLAVVLMLLSVTVVACAKDEGSGGATPSGGASAAAGIEGGQLRIGSLGPDSINPFRGTSLDSYTIFRYAYPYLTEYNEELDGYVGDLAESWDVSDDGTTWTFNLRSGAQWSDGEPLDAEDVVFSFEQYQLPGGAPDPVFKHLESIETPDAQTVILNLDGPVGTTLDGISWGTILPEQTWGKYAGDIKALRAFENPAPWISGGPFILTQHKQDEVDIFERNPNFYGEQPHIDGFGIRAFTDSEAMVAALRTGEVDMVPYLPPTAVEAMKEDGFEVLESPGYEFEELIINSSAKKKDHEELKDPAVRKAFELATDRERMIEVAKVGLATPSWSIVPPIAKGFFNTQVEMLPYDPEEANRILDEAGYERGADGVRVTPDGTKMEYTVYSQLGQQGVNRTAEVLADGFAEIGVKLKHKPLAYNALLDLNYSYDEKGNATYADWDLMIWAWTGNPDPNFILGVLTCAQFGVWSDTGYCDEDYDRMFEEQSTTIDPKERKQIIWAMQDKLYQDKPYVVFFYNNAVSAVSPDWIGYTFGPDGTAGSYNRLSLTGVQQKG